MNEHAVEGYWQRMIESCQVAGIVCHPLCDSIDSDIDALSTGNMLMSRLQLFIYHYSSSWTNVPGCFSHDEDGSFY